MLIRALKQNEVPLLEDFLYEAIYLPPGVPAPDRSIIRQPELRLYYDRFGELPADHCLVAEEDDRVVGAIWSRIMHDYGHVDDDTPSLAISLYGPYRGRGIGSALLRQMLDLLKGQGYRQVSLAVQKENYAVRMYRKAGFQTIRENDSEYIMGCVL